MDYLNYQLFCWKKSNISLPRQSYFVITLFYLKVESGIVMRVYNYTI